MSGRRFAVPEVPVEAMAASYTPRGGRLPDAVLRESFAESCACVDSRLDQGGLGGASGGGATQERPGLVSSSTTPTGVGGSGCGPGGGRLSGGALDQCLLDAGLMGGASAGAGRLLGFFSGSAAAFKRAAADIRPFKATDDGEDWGGLSSFVEVREDLGDKVIDRHAARNGRIRSAILMRARLIQDRLGPGWKGWFVDLTYADEEDFGVGQLSATVECIRKWGLRQGVSIPGVWCLERGEKNGRLHYHLVLWLPKRLSLPKLDVRGWWKFGMTRRARARHHPVGYLAKYAGKGGSPGDLPMPKGARLHGGFGLTLGERLKVAWAHLPGYVREYFTNWEDKPRRAKGGGFVSLVTGDFLESIYRFVGLTAGGNPVIRLKGPEPWSLGLPLLDSSRWIPEEML